MVERVLFGPGGATSEKQDEIISAIASLSPKNRIKLDYTGSPTSSDPVYIGIAPKESLDADPVWNVNKLSYTGVNVSSIELRTSVKWDDRDNPTPGWDT